MAGLVFDFGELKNFSSALERMGKNSARDFLNGQAKQSGARLLAKTKSYTPYVTGNLRNHWQATGIESIPGGCQVEIYNNVYYAPYVEYGHRKNGSNGWVDGRFMMKRATDELQEQLPAILENNIQAEIDRGIR